MKKQEPKLWQQCQRKMDEIDDMRKSQLSELEKTVTKILSNYPEFGKLKEEVEEVVITKKEREQKLLEKNTNEVIKTQKKELTKIVKCKNKTRLKVSLTFFGGDDCYVQFDKILGREEMGSVIFNIGNWEEIKQAVDEIINKEVSQKFSLDSLHKLFPGC